VNCLAVEVELETGLKDKSEEVTIVDNPGSSNGCPATNYLHLLQVL